MLRTGNRSVHGRTTSGYRPHSAHIIGWGRGLSENDQFARAGPTCLYEAFTCGTTAPICSSSGRLSRRRSTKIAPIEPEARANLLH
ncbi:hypothetical protein NDU88_001851 [Pleurodeles waltl]|uniref:Uncharacterized protein n=1 Tax=Pleurodeles waltl TaxID=8319 RepID=A0AAV7NDR6_PLEWA|nr:hypothetical protein NDU88_001851 [Pleurodeles waltl]